METKKLTAKDLMIGDWVYRPDCYDKVVEVRKDTILGSDPLRGLIPIADLQPIPLTAEILEKNGFEKHYDEDCIIYTHPQGIIIEMGINYKLSDDGHFYVRGIQHRLYYIHELQHAMRLCGVDKEIML